MEAVSGMLAPFRYTAGIEPTAVRPTHRVETTGCIDIEMSSPYAFLFPRPGDRAHHPNEDGRLRLEFLALGFRQHLVYLPKTVSGSHRGESHPPPWARSSNHLRITAAPHEMCLPSLVGNVRQFSSASADLPHRPRLPSWIILAIDTGRHKTMSWDDLPDLEFPL